MKSKKQILQDLLERNEVSLVEIRARIRYLQREEIANDSGKPMTYGELGARQAEEKEIEKWVVFLKEIIKEEK